MRFTRFVRGAGLGALLLGAAAITPALAAPTGQRPGWTVVTQPAWEAPGTWYSRTVVVQPTTPIAAAAPVTTPLSVPVTVLAPSGVAETFTEPAFVSTFQQTLLPTIAGVVPVDTLQSGIQVMQVQPNVYALVTPQLYCAADAAGNCQAVAAQLSARTPGFSTMALNGPLGPGVYVVYTA